MARFINSPTIRPLNQLALTLPFGSAEFEMLLGSLWSCINLFFIKLLSLWPKVRQVPTQFDTHSSVSSVGARLLGLLLLLFLVGLPTCCSCRSRTRRGGNLYKVTHFLIKVHEQKQGRIRCEMPTVATEIQHPQVLVSCCLSCACLMNTNWEQIR